MMMMMLGVAGVDDCGFVGRGRARGRGLEFEERFLGERARGRRGAGMRGGRRRLDCFTIGLSDRPMRICRRDGKKGAHLRIKQNFLPHFIIYT